MDFFQCRYFWLNQKLLFLCGLWPYQSQRDRILRMTIFNIAAFSLTFFQVATIFTSQRTLAAFAEVISNQVAALTCVVRAIIYLVQRKKLKGLLEIVKSDWKHTSNADDLKILQNTAEEGRKYNLHFTLYHYSAFSFLVLVILAPSILQIILPRDKPYARLQLIPVEYFVDEEKYFYLILIHMCVVITALLGVLLATDTLYLLFIYHACGLFKIASHHFEHAFDVYEGDTRGLKDGTSDIRMRIMTAVECHRNATEFTEEITATYGTPFFFSLLPVLVNISITLYCTAKYLEKSKLLVVPLVLGISQMIHILILVYPSQKLMDYSAAISFKAYSGLWYVAPFKRQMLLLLVMQRGLKPSFIILGNMMVSSLENYAVAMQTSLSYFTMLLSVG